MPIMPLFGVHYIFTDMSHVFFIHFLNNVTHSICSSLHRRLGRCWRVRGDENPGKSCIGNARVHHAELRSDIGRCSFRSPRGRLDIVIKLSPRRQVSASVTFVLLSPAQATLYFTWQVKSQFPGASRKCSLVLLICFIEKVSSLARV